MPDQAELQDGVRVQHIDAGPAASGDEQDGQRDADLLERVPAFSGPLREHWHRERPDIVHAMRWTSGLAALAAARDLGIPVVQEFSSLGVIEGRHRARAARRRTARPRPGSGSSPPSGVAPPPWSRPTPPRCRTWLASVSSGPPSGSSRGASTPTRSRRKARLPSGTADPGCSPRRTEGARGVRDAAAGAHPGSRCRAHDRRWPGPRRPADRRGLRRPRQVRRDAGHLRPG